MVNIDGAKTHVSRMFDAAATGEQIIIAKSGTPTARRVPIEWTKAMRRFGALKGKVHVAADFDAPLPDEVG